MTLNSDTLGRLYNGKYEDAKWTLDGHETPEERRLVLLLGNKYGGSGWGGAEDLDEVGEYLLEQLLGGDLEDEQLWIGREKEEGRQEFEVTYTKKERHTARDGRALPSFNEARDQGFEIRVEPV